MKETMHESENVNTLTFEQFKKAVLWVIEKKVYCEICYPQVSDRPNFPINELFEIPKHLFAPLIFMNGTLCTGQFFPQFMAVCIGCGNTKYFNAIAAGIIEPYLSKK